jgi:putative hemolysin
MIVSIWIVLGIIVIIVLIVFAGFFAAVEMAFVSVSRAVIAERARAGDRNAIVLRDLLKDPSSVISAIVVGNSLVNILSSILAGWIATELLGNLGVGVATAVMFFSLLIFGEATPKALGIYNDRFALRFAGALKTVRMVFHPMVVLLNWVSGRLLRRAGRSSVTRRRITEQDIMAMMKLGEEEGTIASDEERMVREVFEFDETHAYEIYTPRDKIVFIQADSSAAELKKLYLETQYSRFPVYGRDRDDVVGMVHVKDLLGLKDLGVPVRTFMREALVVDARTKVDDVLRLMKRKRTHMALLLDHQKKVVGLVSMEDLIEEVFGEIADEHD